MFSVQSICVLLLSFLTGRRIGLSLKLFVDVLLLFFVIFSAKIFIEWSQIPHGFPDVPENFKTRFFFESKNRNDGAENYEKFHFQLFMGVIIITMWAKLYATASNTYVAGPTMRIIIEMFR